MKTLFMTNELRKTLGKSLGLPIFGNKAAVAKKFEKQRKKFTKIITVGDYCSSALASDVKIFDGKTQRNKQFSLQKYSFLFPNPPASINRRAWHVLEEAINQNKNVYVKGEEDLLAIPAILLSEPGTAVIYGIPEKGICLIEGSDEIKKNIEKILCKFREERFEKIILGGTFDKLHLGHQYFLSMAKYYAKKGIIGLCSYKMAKKRKKYRVLPFEKRKQAIENYLAQIKFPAKVVEINDLYGSAGRDKSIDSILLTSDTLKNGLKINELREKNGLQDLNYITIQYLLNNLGKKISRRDMGY